MPQTKKPCEWCKHPTDVATLTKNEGLCAECYAIACGIDEHYERKRSKELRRTFGGRIYA